MTYVIDRGMALYWGTSRWSAVEIMVSSNAGTWDGWEAPPHTYTHPSPSQEAYSVARQFNLVAPVCEQAEYHLFQRHKVESQLPTLYHHIGEPGLGGAWEPPGVGRKQVGTQRGWGGKVALVWPSVGFRVNVTFVASSALCAAHQYVSEAALQSWLALLSTAGPSCDFGHQ